jgi:hypothetical protein
MLPKLERMALPSPHFWKILITFAVLFLAGGSSRVDVRSQAIVNPAIIVCCGAAVLTLRREQWPERKWRAAVLGFVFILGLSYVVPLPVHPEVYSQGMSAAADIRTATKISGSPQTLAMVPQTALQCAFLCLPHLPSLPQVRTERVATVRTFGSLRPPPSQ